MRARVPIDRMESPGLYRSYAAGSDAILGELLGGFDDSAERWERALDMPGLSGEPGTRARLVEDLIDYNRRVGASGAILDRLAAGGGRDVRFVITGQQPGPLGGPLMVAYKIATAVALAERLEARCGAAVVPLYWMGSDDIDFAEVRDFTVLSADLTPVRAAIARDAHPAAAPVGAIPGDAVAALWRSVSPILRGLPGFPGTDAAAFAALEAAPDHGEVTARLLMWMFGGAIAVVDGRAGSIRRHARDLILRYFDEEEDLLEVAHKRGRALEEQGFHAQLVQGPDSGVFLMQDGARRKVPRDGRAAARAHFESRIEDASPGVVLRTLVQDAVFAPVAVVLGPAEIAYRAQIADLYGRLDVKRPIAFPRLSATWVPAPVDGAADAAGVDAALAGTDPAAFAAAVYSSQDDGRAGEAVAAFLSEFSAARDSFLATIKKSAGESGSRLVKRLGDVDRRLRAALESVSDGGKDRALMKWPFLGHLEDAVHSGGERQERYLAALALHLHDPSGAAEKIAALAGDHVDAALDGRIDHIVYSS